MTADELARVTAERDAAVAALARVARLPQEWREADEWTRCTCGNCCADDVERALAGPESDAGAEVAVGATDELTGAQIGAQSHCPDCEWVEDKDLDTDERRTRRGRACQRHGGPLAAKEAGERRLGR